MSKMQTPKKIRIEDFAGEFQDLLKRLGYTLNPFMDEVYSILNNNIDYDNFRRQLVDVNISTTDSGGLQTNPEIRLTLNGKVKGITIINVNNLTNINTYLNVTPLIYWTIQGDILKITHIGSLANSTKYLFTVEIIYN